MHSKIYPQALPSPGTCYLTSEQETFTIWMRSLVMSGKGCTVFDSNGQVVFRVDNYHCKCINEVHLMDFRGKVLFSMLRKKFKWLGLWDGYRATSADTIDKTKPWFQVRKTMRMVVRGRPTCKIIVGADKNQPCQYKMGSWTSESTCKIVDESGGLVAEVTLSDHEKVLRFVFTRVVIDSKNWHSKRHKTEVWRKQSKGGVMLGEDVMTMVVEPFIDHSLVMCLVIVYSLINGKL